MIQPITRFPGHVLKGTWCEHSSSIMKAIMSLCMRKITPHPSYHNPKCSSWFLIFNTPVLYFSSFSTAVHFMQMRPHFHSLNISFPSFIIQLWMRSWEISWKRKKSKQSRAVVVMKGKNDNTAWPVSYGRSRRKRKMMLGWMKRVEREGSERTDMIWMLVSDPLTFL